MSNQPPAAPIEAEVVPPEGTALPAVRQPQAGAVSTERMTVEQLQDNLRFIREVMQSVMKEGQDYGKVPGCGDKPALLQPGAQKLCMTFQLQDRVKKEEVRDLPNYHREYAFTVCLVSATGKEWDGVGTCSTLEGKYRYRNSSKKCPQCGRPTLLQSKKGKPEWFCWTKKGGCGATFPLDDPKITSQQDGKVEHDNPADNWNTVRKMAFKRALVHAAINATNTSELWTQDIEDGAGSPDDAPPPPSPAKPAAGVQTPPATQKPAPAPAKPQGAPSEPATPPPSGSPAAMPTEEHRTRMLNLLKAQTGGANRQTVEEYFRKLSNPTPLMPNEPLEKLELRFVPATKEQMQDLSAKVARFAAGDPAEYAFPPHAGPLEPPPPPGTKPASRVVPKVMEGVNAQNPEWWRQMIVPIPRKGEKRDAYLKHPDTIGSLFDARHGQDEESQAARQRLWGFVEHYEPKGWTGNDGKLRPASAADRKFREALDAFKEWFAANHPGEKL